MDPGIIVGIGPNIQIQFPLKSNFSVNMNKPKFKYFIRSSSGPGLFIRGWIWIYSFTVEGRIRINNPGRNIILETLLLAKVIYTSRVVYTVQYS